jgi:hypothetical protein
MTNLATDLHDYTSPEKHEPGGYKLKENERFVDAPVELELNDSQLTAGADEMAELKVKINKNRQDARDAAAAVRKLVKEDEARLLELAEERIARKRTITMQCVEVTNFPNDKRIVFPHPDHPSARVIGEPVPLTKEELQTPMFEPDPDEDGVFHPVAGAAESNGGAGKEAPRRGPGRPKGSKNKGTHKPGAAAH